MVDAEGTRYIDLVQSYGAVLLGHAHPAVTAAIGARRRPGTTFGAPTPGEVLLAEAICARVPGCEQVRLVSSGTEAAMSAVRLARGATGRDRVVKFDGCYHGHSDGLLAGGGSGVATLGLPGSAGVPAGAVADTVVAPYNVVPELDDTVACVIVEPVAANMNLVPPAPGFLAGLRTACDAAGALLDLRRGHHRFPLRARRGHGMVGGHPRPVVLRQGHRRAVCPWVPSEAEPICWPRWPRPARCTKRAPCRAIRWPRRPAWPCSTRCVRRDYDELGARVGVFAKELESAIAAGGLAVAVPTVGPLVGLFLAPAGEDRSSRPSTT